MGTNQPIFHSAQLRGTTLRYTARQVYCRRGYESSPNSTPFPQSHPIFASSLSCRTSSRHISPQFERFILPHPTLLAYTHTRKLQQEARVSLCFSTHRHGHPLAFTRAKRGRTKWRRPVLCNCHVVVQSSAHAQET